eukprot:PhF_6_TR36314/c0_g1_i1/m.53105
MLVSIAFGLCLFGIVIPSVRGTAVGQMERWIGTGSTTLTGDGSAVSASTSWRAPADLAYNYVSDSFFLVEGSSCRIRRIAGGAFGTVSTVLGPSTDAETLCGDTVSTDPSLLRLSTPTGIWFYVARNSHPTLIVTASASHRLYKWDFTLNTVDLICGTGTDTAVFNVVCAGNTIGYVTYVEVTNDKMYMSVTNANKVSRYSLLTTYNTELGTVSQSHGIAVYKAYVMTITYQGYQIFAVNSLTGAAIVFAGGSAAGAALNPVLFFQTMFI